jgi:hypothetical protein
MRKSLLFSIALITSFLLQAQLPVKMDQNLSNIRVDVPFGLTVDEPLNMVPGNNPFVVSSTSKAISEYVVGGTKYDLQSNGASQNRIYRWPDGSIAATWTMGQADPSFTDRGAGYNFFNGSAWGSTPTIRLETTRTGWPSIAPLGSAGEIVVTHNGNTGLEILKRTSKGSGTWSQSTIIGPLASNSSTAMLWPRMITSGTNRENIHIIATSDQDDPVATYMGLDLALVYNRSQDGGQTWNVVNAVLPGMDTSSYVGFRGDTYAWAEPKGDTIAFVIGDNWHDLILMKSNNGGTTWQKTVIFQHPFPKFMESTTLVLDTPYVCEGGVSVALDNNGQAHVVYGLMRVMNDDLTDGTTSYFPITDGMGYWNESMPTLTNIHVDTLYNNGTLVAYMLDLNNDNQINWVGTGTGILGTYYQSLVSQPYLIIDQANDLYLVFSMVMESLNNGIQHYRHVWARKSTDGGMTWSNFTDLTMASAHDFDECVFPSQAPVTDDNLHVLAQIDYEPGLAVRGDLDIYDANDIVYITLPKAEIGANIGMEENVSIMRMNVFPNPGNGEFTLGVTLSEVASGQLLISNLMGQVILNRTLENLSTGPQLIPVNLTGFSTGIYSMSLRVAGQVRSTMLVIN